MSKNPKEFLKECKRAYYAGDPIISDSQYDFLENLCQEELGVGTDRGRIKHWYRMYSLQKCYQGEEYPIEGDLICTPKLDGAAIALRYLNGELSSVLTRGDGIYGEDVSHLFFHCKDNTELNIGIPFTYLQDKGPVQICGELVAPKEIENARNYAAGALSLKHGEDFIKRDLYFFAYDVMPNITPYYNTDMEYLSINEGIDTTWDYPTLSRFPTDGSVFRLASNARYHAMGFTSKHPKGSFALKVRSEGVQTTLLDVIWQTGKTGKVTPVAILEPVKIEGATVSRATLNNPGFIEALDLSIGDSVMVERAGGIIPRIIKKAE